MQLRKAVTGIGLVLVSLKRDSKIMKPNEK
jgi:hypothetical protein